MKEGRKESSEYQMMTGVSYTCGEKKKKKRKKADETQWSSGGTLPYVSLYKHDSMPNGGSSVKLSNPKRFSVVNHVWRLVVVFNDQSGSVSSAPLPAQDSRFQRAGASFWWGFDEWGLYNHQSTDPSATYYCIANLLFIQYVLYKLRTTKYTLLKIGGDWRAVDELYQCTTMKL